MTKIILIGSVLIVGFLLWWYSGKWTQHYRESNINWRVSGSVSDAGTKAPLTDVDVKVSCREAITPNHKVRGAAVSSTNFVIKASENGEFQAQAFGGRISLEFRRQGYEVRYWEQNSRGRQSGSETNVRIEMTPISSETATHK